MSNRSIWQTLEHPKSRPEISNRSNRKKPSKKFHFTGVLSESKNNPLGSKVNNEQMASKKISKKPRSNLSSEMAYIYTCDTFVYV